MTAMTNFATDCHLWCYNTGVTSNMTLFVEGLYDVKKIDGNIKIGDGTGLKSTLIGKKDYIIKYKDGTMQSLTLTVKIMPNMQYNLISRLQAFDNGYKVKEDKDGFALVKGDAKIRFNWRTEGTRGLFCIRLLPVDHNVATPALTKNSKVEYNKLHGKFGHAHEEWV